MKPTSQLFCLLLLSFPFCLSASEPSPVPQAPERPRLVIGIVVDQMRYEYLQRYWAKFGEGGFKKMVAEGFLCKNMHYNYVPTYTGPGHASIFTGTTPSVHGIISNSIYSRSSGGLYYCVRDERVSPLGTTDSLSRASPVHLFASTIGDELKRATNERAKVFGVALKDRAAILSAGHSANGAFWYDGSTGHWVSSTYYMHALPGWVEKFNQKNRADAYLRQAWTTLLPLNSYVESTADNNSWEVPFAGEANPVFPHDLPSLKAGNGGYYLLNATPFGNALTREFAEALIEGEQLGKDAVTDLLALSFSATDYIGHSFGPNAIETEDAYLRLDRELQDFISYLDKQIGPENYLIFLTADHGVSAAPGFNHSRHMPGGYINPQQLASLTKAMLTEQYGTGELLLAYHDFQYYLNRELIQKKGLALSEVRQSLVRFAGSMQGIAAAVATRDLLSGKACGGIMELVANGIYPKLSGDVVLLFQPGWMQGYGKGATHGSPYAYDTHVPLIWYGQGIPKGDTSRRLCITDIASTLADMLGISAPDGCSGHVIRFRK